MNATDIALIIDAMELLHGGRVAGFCLIASDGDYSQSTIRIRKQGRPVLGFMASPPHLALTAACCCGSGCPLPCCLIFKQTGERGYESTAWSAPRQLAYRFIHRFRGQAPQHEFLSRTAALFAPAGSEELPSVLADRLGRWRPAAFRRGSTSSAWTTFCSRERVARHGVPQGGAGYWAQKKKTRPGPGGRYRERRVPHRQA
jgi:hypothetical protein